MREIKNMRTKSISSLTIAILINIQLITSAISVLFSIKSGTLQSIFIFILVSVVSILLGSNKKTNLRFYLLPLYFLFVILTMALFGLNSQLSLFEILFYVVLSYISVSMDFDISEVLNYTLFIGILCSPFVLFLLSRSFVDGRLLETSLSLSYSMLSYFICVIAHFTYFRKRTYIYSAIYIISFLSLLLSLRYGNRGYAFSLFIAVFLVFQNRTNSKVQSTRLFVFLSIMMFLGMVLFLNFETILILMKQALNFYGISFDFITKTLTLIELGDITNGRSLLYYQAIQGIVRSPLWGWGIDTFGMNNGYITSYPHNLFLQLFYDGGILIGLPVTYLIFYGIKEFFAHGYNTDESVLFIVFFVSSVPRLLVSQDIWLTQTLWLLIGLVSFSRYKVQRGYKNG